MVEMEYYRDNEYVYINNPDGTTKRMTITDFESMLNGTDEYVRVDPTLTHSGQAADAKVTGDEISDLKEDLSDIDTGLYVGEYTLTPNDFVQGQWSNTPPSGVASSSARNIRTKKGYHIEPGSTLTTRPSTPKLYMRWTLFDDDDNVVEEYRGGYDKSEILDTTHSFQHSGTLYITVANGHNYGNSSDITPDDMSATIVVSNTFAGRLQEDIDNLSELYPEVRKLRFNETATTTTASTLLYYPMEFIDGQTYIIEVKFSAFTSSANRKYSLRTTTDKYISANYTVQMVAIRDVASPTIGQLYTYKFQAITNANGKNGKYLAVELNPTTGKEATCEIKVYSIKAEDAQTDIDALSYLTATDIVSLNHDVPDKVLNGLNPFNRETTTPFALLHFSDIHGNSVNLSRLVQMGNHLGTLIDDVVCTGDIVSNNYSATAMDFWNDVDGAKNILMVVGNHDLADGQHGYSSDQIGQTVAYQTYILPYYANWGITLAGENLTYWYKDYPTKKVRLIGLNYLLTGDASTAQKTWLAARLSEAKTAGYAVVIAEHSPLNSFIEIPCNFNIIGKAWGYNEILADIQSAVQDFIDDGGEFACYIAGHSHSDYVGYSSDYPDQICVVVTTALTTRMDNDQRRVVGEKSQDAANVVLVDTVTKTVKLVRIGADMDTYLRGRHLFSIRYTDKTVIAQS